MVSQASAEETDEWVNCQHLLRAGEPLGYLAWIQCEVSHLLAYWEHCPKQLEWVVQWLLLRRLRLEPSQERKSSPTVVFSVQFYRLLA